MIIELALIVALLVIWLLTALKTWGLYARLIGLAKRRCMFCIARAGVSGTSSISATTADSRLTKSINRALVETYRSCSIPLSTQR